MFREISFIHEGAQYFTVTGSQYLMSALSTNAATSVTINSKASYQSEMRKLNNGSSRFALEIPMVENAEVTTKDGFFYLKGVVKTDGKEYKVELTKDELKIEGDKAEAPAPKKEQAAPAPAQKKEETPAPAPEPKKEETKPAQEPAPVEEKKEDPAPKTAEEKKAFVMGEASQPPEARPPKQVSKPKEKARGFVLGEKRATDVSQQLVLGEANQVEGCVFRGRAQVPGKPRGRYNNGMRHPRGTQLVDQSYTEHTQPARRRVEEPAPEPQPEYRPMFPQKPVTRQEPVEPYVPEARPIPEDLDTSNLYDRPLSERESAPTSPFMSAEELAKEYRAANGINIGVSVHNTTPAPLGATAEEENAQPKSRKDRAEEKRRVRAMLSEEVSAIIGDIPHEMLGSIEEFTTDVVDSATLNKQGNLFCIDHRWHKNGNWFCIDVVPNAARYFYNNTRDVSMEISLKDLRAWQQAIG